MNDTRPFRVGFVPGVMPDKWFGRWRERTPHDALEAVPVEDADQESVLRDGRVDMCFVRLPVERGGLHVIPLYVEQHVAVLPREHELTVLDELSVADLAHEQPVLPPETLPGWAEVASVERLEFPAMSVKDAIEVVASGTGFVVVPRSLARLHQRKDVETRPVADGPESRVGLAWLVDNDDERVERFIGIVRGRTANTSRAAEAAPKPGRTAPPPRRRPAQPKRPQKQSRTSSRKRRGR